MAVVEATESIVLVLSGSGVRTDVRAGDAFDHDDPLVLQFPQFFAPPAPKKPNVNAGRGDQ